MPVVLRMDGFVFRVNTYDHPPPHVHVRVAGTWARIAVGPLRAEPYLMPGCTMRDKDVAGALEIARTCQAHLLSEWRNYHGGDH
ncbi:DUF4160 domain-containing protein [Longimicrobium sp.]|uniref:DUF4160 domain-containing protein n=1 Tax=Longimicrobium sp. TaxID=2029185 RepID=UPI002ED7F44D